MAGKLLYAGNILSLPAEAADRLLGAGNGDAALLYLYLLRRGGVFEPERAARTLRWEVRRGEEAFAALVQMGLADREAKAAPAPQPEPDEPPEYTAADLNREMEDAASPFPALVGEVQRRLGKILSTADLKMLYTLYDYLALPAEVIMLLVSWCIEEMERKYGPGRRPRMPQIRKEGFAWRRLGLDTAEAAERHLALLAQREKNEAAVAGVFGLENAKFTKLEKNMIAAWFEEYGYGREMIAEALAEAGEHRTVRYVNGILRAWYTKGHRTVRDVMAESAGTMRNFQPASPAPKPVLGRGLRRVPKFEKNGGAGHDE